MPPALWGFLSSTVVRNLPASVGDTGDMGSVPWVVKIPLGKEMVIHSSILAWKIPQTEEPGRLQFIGLQKNLT